MTDNHSIGFIQSTNHSLKGVVNDRWSTELFDIAIELIEKGVEVLLIFSKEMEKSLTIDPFLLNRILLINKKGGAIYFQKEQKTTDQSFYIKDYDEVCTLSGGASEIIHDIEDSGLLREYLNLFNVLEQQSEIYLKKPNDLSIKFNLSDEVILVGDEVKLSWQVDNSTKVIIQSIGEVDEIGFKKLRPGTNTIFKIGAYNDEQASFRTQSVKVYQDVDINYDIGFINDRTKQITSLIKEENYPHTFGVARGNVITFSWWVGDARSVLITPFNIIKRSGEHRFTPEESLEIEIRVEIFNREFVRKIQILVFPIPVMRDKLLPTFNLPQHFQYNLPTQSDINKLFNLIKESQDVHNQSLDELIIHEEKRYEELNELIEKLHFDNSDNKYNFSSLNGRVFTKLQRFYGKKPHITEVIQSIKAYYDRPQKRE